MYEKLELWIDGQWRQGSTGVTEPVLNPATEEILAELPHASEADLDEALGAAERSFREWRAVNPYKRSALLHRVADLLQWLVMPDRRLPDHSETSVFLSRKLCRQLTHR